MTWVLFFQWFVGRTGWGEIPAELPCAPVQSIFALYGFFFTRTVPAMNFWFRRFFVSLYLLGLPGLHAATELEKFANVQLL